MIVNRYTNSSELTPEEINSGQISNAGETLMFLETGGDIILTVLPLVIMIVNAIAVQRNYPYVLIVKYNKWHHQNSN